MTHPIFFCALALMAAPAFGSGVSTNGRALMAGQTNTSFREVNSKSV